MSTQQKKSSKKVGRCRDSAANKAYKAGNRKAVNKIKRMMRAFKRGGNKDMQTALGLAVYYRDDAASFRTAAREVGFIEDWKHYGDSLSIPGVGAALADAWDRNGDGRHGARVIHLAYPHGPSAKGVGTVVEKVLRSTGERVLVDSQPGKHEKVYACIAGRGWELVRKSKLADVPKNEKLGYAFGVSHG